MSFSKSLGNSFIINWKMRQQTVGDDCPKGRRGFQNGPLNFGKKKTRLRNKEAKRILSKMALLGHASFELA